MDEIVEKIAIRLYKVGCIVHPNWSIEDESWKREWRRKARALHKEIKPLILSQVRQELEKEFVELAHYKRWQAFWRKYG